MKIPIIACLLISTSFAILADEVPYAITKIVYDDDKSANNIEYFGFGLPGASTAASVWKMFRITYTGTDFVLE